MTQITISPAPTAEEARNQPREFAAYSLLNKGGKIDSEALQSAIKKLGGGSASELSGTVTFAQLAKALYRTGEPKEGSGDAVGWAIQKKDAEMAAWKFERRQPGKTDIYIEIVWCGICHSDLHQVKSEWGESIYPMVPGHEIAGIVCAYGSDVKGWELGQKIGVGCFVDACRECHPCKIGDDNYCPKCVLTYNSKDKQGKPTYGGYSTHIVVDYRYCLHIPDNLKFDSVAPLLCAGITTYSPLRHYGFDKPGFRLGVVGLGGLGHMAVLLGKAMGCEVTVISTSPNKKEEAMKNLGADHFLVSKDEKAMEAKKGQLDGIIDTVSANHDAVPLIDLLDINGTLVVVGVPSEPMSIPNGALLGGRKRVGGSMIGGIPETQEMLDFCGKHNIVCRSEIVPVTYVEKAYERLMKNDVHYRFVLDIQGTLLREA